MLYLPCAAPISLPCAVPISIRVTTIAMIPSRMNVIVNDQDVRDTLNLVLKTNIIDTKRSELKSRLIIFILFLYLEINKKLTFVKEYDILYSNSAKDMPSLFMMC